MFGECGGGAGKWSVGWVGGDRGMGGERCVVLVFFFQAEDGIRELVRSRGLGDVYKRQRLRRARVRARQGLAPGGEPVLPCAAARVHGQGGLCLLYTSDAADDLLCVDLGGRRIIKKKKTLTISIDSTTPETTTNNSV